MFLTWWFIDLGVFFEIDLLTFMTFRTSVLELCLLGGCECGCSSGCNGGVGMTEPEYPHAYCIIY